MKEYRRDTQSRAAVGHGQAAAAGGPRTAQQPQVLCADPLEQLKGKYDEVEQVRPGRAGLAGRQAGGRARGRAGRQHSGLRGNRKPGTGAPCCLAHPLPSMRNPALAVSSPVLQTLQAALECMLAATSNEDLGAVEMQIRWGLPGAYPLQWSLSCFTAPPDEWRQPLKNRPGKPCRASCPTTGACLQPDGLHQGYAEAGV